MKRMNLGDILLSMGAIDTLQLHSALAHQRQWGTPLGKALVDSRFCTQDQLMQALSRQAGLPVANLRLAPPDPTLAGLVSRKVAEQHRVVPLRLEGKRQEVLVVAVAAPASLAALDAVQAVSGKTRVVAYLADDDAITRAIGQLYLGLGADEPIPAPAPDVTPDDGLDLDIELDIEEVVEAGPRPVLIYGWGEEAGRQLAQVLGARGVAARVCGSVEALACEAEDVLIAPLPSIEAVLSKSRRLRGKLIVATRHPETEASRARGVGASGIVGAPLDAELLVRAVRRCQQVGGVPAARA